MSETNAVIVCPLCKGWLDMTSLAPFSKAFKKNLSTYVEQGAGVEHWGHQQAHDARVCRCEFRGRLSEI